MGMLHAHVSAAQKNLVMWCLGGKSLSGGQTYVTQVRVFFKYRTGRQCVIDSSFPFKSHILPSLLFSPADVCMYMYLNS